VDPITLELARPALLRCCRAGHASQAMVLGLLLPSATPAEAWGQQHVQQQPAQAAVQQAPVPEDAAAAPAEAGAGDAPAPVADPGGDFQLAASASTNALPLAPPVRRFALLPLPLDAFGPGGGSGGGRVGHHHPGSPLSGGGSGLGGGAGGDLLGNMPGIDGGGLASAYASPGGDRGAAAGGGTGAGFGLLSNLRFKW